MVQPSLPSRGVEVILAAPEKRIIVKGSLNEMNEWNVTFTELNIRHPKKMWSTWESRDGAVSESTRSTVMFPSRFGVGCFPWPKEENQQHFSCWWLSCLVLFLVPPMLAYAMLLHTPPSYFFKFQFDLSFEGQRQCPCSHKWECVSVKGVGW